MIRLIQFNENADVASIVANANDMLKLFLKEKVMLYRETCSETGANADDTSDEYATLVSYIKALAKATNTKLDRDDLRNIDVGAEARLLWHYVLTLLKIWIEQRERELRRIREIGDVVEEIQLER